MLEIKVASQWAGQKTIEAEPAWVNCGATSGHFMNSKRRTVEKKEARWSAHNYHTSMNVCMHDINIKTVSATKWLPV